jgi:maltose alpha-D-glucosyltransferase/alpha-amylase
MQLYGRGIRRRLAPMLGGDRRRIELAFALLLSLPGTPVVYYGDEIGMGEDLSLREREPVRTPMQWSPARNGGFSAAPRARLVAPVVSRGPFAYRAVNVTDQRRDPGALVHFVERAIRTWKQLPELTKGSWEIFPTGTPSVFGMRFELEGRVAVTLHNLSGEPVRARIPERGLVDALANRDYEPAGATAELDGYGFRWLRPPDVV